MPPKKKNNEDSGDQLTRIAIVNEQRWARYLFRARTATRGQPFSLLHSWSRCMRQQCRQSLRLVSSSRLHGAPQL